MSNISIIIVNHKSSDKTLKFIKKIPSNYKIIIVDNSEDGKFKKKIKIKNHIKIIETENFGYGSAINTGRKIINTNFFFAFSPDLEGVDKKFLDKFEGVIKSGLNFGALGPRFINVKEKSHRQSDIKKKIGRIKAISGAAILLNTQAFDSINGFDENIFLFFEENDLCARIIKKNFQIYQLNEAKIFHPKGVKNGVVGTKNYNFSTLQNFYGWHYMWSKFYHYKKNKYFIFTYFFFIPIFLRLLLRITFYFLINSKPKKEKYLMRMSGLIASILNKKSFKYNTVGKEEISSVVDIMKKGELSGFVAAPNQGFYGRRVYSVVVQCIKFAQEAQDLDKRVSSALFHQTKPVDSIVDDFLNILNVFFHKPP